jgi:hypothetical protein
VYLGRGYPDSPLDFRAHVIWDLTHDLGKEGVPGRLDPCIGFGRSVSKGGRSALEHLSGLWNSPLVTVIGRRSTLPFNCYNQGLFFWAVRRGSIASLGGSSGNTRTLRTCSRCCGLEKL